MLIIGPSAIRYVPGEEDIQMPIIQIIGPTIASKNFELYSVQSNKKEHSDTDVGFDAWMQIFPLEEELRLVKKAIQRAKKGKRLHIRGISSAESVHAIAEYYSQQGYKDMFGRYSIPPNEVLTVNISLRHFLFCDKDKSFLMTNDQGPMTNDIPNSIIQNPIITSRPYYAIVPPLRTSHNLRTIQQAVRMGMIPLVEVFPGDEQFLPICLEKELISLFQLGQVCGYNWEEYIKGLKGITTITQARFSL